MTSIILSTVTDGDGVDFSLTETGLTITGQPTYEQWEAFGRDLGKRYSGIQWSVGNWLNEGEKRYGEKYAQAADDICFAPGTLRNYASICGRIPYAVRHRKLHFHRTKHVAPLAIPEQERIIAFAVEHNLTGEAIKDIVDKLLNRQPHEMNDIEGTIAEIYGDALLVNLSDIRLTVDTALKVGQVVILRVKA